MSDTIPVVVGIALSIFFVRWLVSTWQRKFFDHLDNRMLDQPRAPPTEAISQLATMFPGVPVSVIRSELVRGGSVQAAVERLLIISPNYPSRAPAPRAPVTTQVYHMRRLFTFPEHPESDEAIAGSR